MNGILQFILFFNDNVFVLQGMDLSLDSAEALRELMGVATGKAYTDELGVFESGGTSTTRAPGLKRVMTDMSKEEATREALRNAAEGCPGSNRGKRMKLGPNAISRRVTEGKKATFGHQPRTQAYGRKRWKTHTGALISAENEAIISTLE